MHAEMTVGLDLCSLENLKIFNGHDTVKKESRRSIESSPEHKPADSDSDDQQELQLQQRHKKGRQKCGRPANPIPRHKRQSHIKAEYKRRDKIQKGFDSLVFLVPELSDANSAKESKSAMLYKAAEYCRRLKGESGNMQSEMDALRQELEALGTEIHDLQQRLPQQGLDVVEKESVKMDTLYDQYVRDESKKNWKFWIFGFFMRPLYMSYRQSVSSISSRREFSTAVSEWIRDTLSLTSLRKGFFEALRKISVQTGIMTSPEKLEEEAVQSMAIHYVKELPAPSEKTTPHSPRKPKSEVTTPIPSPVHSTPIPSPTTHSPAISRRPSTHVRPVNRESRKSKESRSRSSTPPMEESRPKRRTSHNRGDRHCEPDGTHSGKRSRATSPRTLSIETPYSQPFLVPVSNPASTIFTPMPVQRSYVPIQIAPSTGVQEKDLVQALKLLLHRTSQASLVPANTSIPTSREVVPTFTNSSTASSFSQPLMVTHLPISEPMETCQVSAPHSQTSQSFLPVDQSGIITNSTLLTLDDSITDSFPTPAIPDLQSILTEDSMSCQSSLSLDQLNPAVLTTAQPTVSLCQPRMSSSTIHEPMVSGTQQLPVTTLASGFPFHNPDEDSLTNMLTVDVMDINSVLTFFSDDQNKSS